MILMILLDLVMGESLTSQVLLPDPVQTPSPAGNRYLMTSRMRLPCGSLLVMLISEGKSHLMLNAASTAALGYVDVYAHNIWFCWHTVVLVTLRGILAMRS